MVDAIVLSPTDAASQEPVVGSVQRVVVARARAPRDAAVQYCLEYLGSQYSDFELEGSARSVVTAVLLFRIVAWGQHVFVFRVDMPDSTP